MEEHNPVKVLVAILDVEISRSEITFFRGAVIASMGEQTNILLHNHVDDTQYRYSYPLVQYKRIDKQAAIVCINEGTEQLGQFLSQAVRTLTLGKRKVEINQYQVYPMQGEIQVNPYYTSYHISQWLPLNPDNLKRYQEAASLADRVQLLQQILKGNILSMCKGLGIQIDEMIEVNITALSNPTQIRYKGINMMAFDADFTSNITLPSHIGLGKYASVGFGMITTE